MFSNVFATCNYDFCAKGTSMAITRNYYKTTAKCCIWTPGPRFLPSDHWSQMLLQCLVDVESLHMYGFFSDLFLFFTGYCENIYRARHYHYHQMVGIPCHQGPGRQLMDTHHVLSRRTIGSKQHANR